MAEESNPRLASKVAMAPAIDAADFPVVTGGASFAGWVADDESSRIPVGVVVVRESRAVCAECDGDWDGEDAFDLGAVHAAGHGHAVHADSYLAMRFEAEPVDRVAGAPASDGVRLDATAADAAEIGVF